MIAIRIVVLIIEFFPWGCFSVLLSFNKVDLLITYRLIVMIQILISVPSFHNLYGHLRFGTLTNYFIQKCVAVRGLGFCQETQEADASA